MGLRWDSLSFVLSVPQLLHVSAGIVPIEGNKLSRSSRRGRFSLLPLRVPLWRLAAVGWSWDQLEGSGVVGAYDGEVTPVECGDPGDLQALGKSDQARVGPTEPEVGVCLDEFGDPERFSGCDALDLQLACGDSTEERGLRGCADLSAYQVGGLGDDERGCYEGALPFDRLHAPVVIRVGLVSSREEDARVDDEQASALAEAFGEEFVGLARSPA